jgi:hypothetical protein
MKYILLQSALLRFQWELDIVITNILGHDPKAEMICVFTQDEQSVIDHISSRYPTVSVHAYEDTRADKSYAPSTRPFLWYCYLSEDSKREKDTYFQIDCDVIFRELPDWSKVKVTPKQWAGSDCGQYIDYQYLKSVEQGEYIVDKFAEIIGIDRKHIEESDGVGAQWVLCEPTAGYWLDVYNASNNLHYFLEPLKSNIQKWTAEMWAQLYCSYKYGIKQVISPELDFCRPTDHVKMWEMTKILHNAGVVGELANSLFYKNKYYDRTPFGDNFDYVYRDKAGWFYVQAIYKVYGNISV